MLVMICLMFLQTSTTISLAPEGFDRPQGTKKERKVAVGALLALSLTSSDDHVEKKYTEIFANTQLDDNTSHHVEF